MLGKFIIFAILAVLLYAFFIRMKERITIAPTQNKQRLGNTKEKRGVFGDVRFNKIHIIITFLAVLYLIWAIITLYR